MKAFPTGIRVSPDQYDTGMDLRDYFAAKFIPEICKYSEVHGWNYESNAKICYAMADAMLKARESTN